MTKVLYLIACAAPPARDVDRLVRMAQGEYWDVCLRLDRILAAFAFLSRKSRTDCSSCSRTAHCAWH